MLETLAQSWLNLQCQMLPHVQRAMVAMDATGEGAPIPVAYWPEGVRNTTGLVTAAQQAISQEADVVRAWEGTGQNEPARMLVACPLAVDERVLGVVAVEVGTLGEPQQRAMLQLLRWGAPWLDLLQQRETTGVTERLVTLVQVITRGIQHERFRAAATAATTDLARQLGCERVSLGFVERGRTRVGALSNSANFDRRTNLVRDIEAAMDESLAHDATIAFPLGPDDSTAIASAHGQLASRHGAGAVCTVPLHHDGRAIGALTLERRADRPFDDSTVELCDAVGGLLAPILESKRAQDRPVPVRIAAGLARAASRVLGPGRIVAKLLAISALGLIAYLALATGDYRIAATATLEGSVQRALVAPFAGYVAHANARAGALVERGDVLAELDSRELELERRRWAGEREEFSKEYLRALAKLDRAQARILGTQIGQADTQLAMLDDQLERVQVVAPFDGLVVYGDLSQSLGAPVERGQVLFEVAPLDGYRVALRVDEHEVAKVSPGQSGHLALTAMPGERFGFTVESITGVTQTDADGNAFRVEAKLDEAASPYLRPGMEGVGKVFVERRSRLWIWTHTVIERVRLWAWAHLP